MRRMHRLSASASILLLALLAACGSIDVDATLQEGVDALERGDLDAAEDAFLAVYDEDPTGSLANYNLGLLEQTRGRTDLAEGYYRDALETDPSFTSAMYNLAL